MVVDPDYQDYVELQALLEKTVGVRLARQQPYKPSGGTVLSVVVTSPY